jgi:hypothetical protein
MMTWVRRSIAVAVLAAFVPVATTGCFGRFEATRQIYQFNKEIHPNKWVVWIAFLVMSFIPIYGIGVFVDVIILNSVEFWTGANPMVTDLPSTLTGPNGEVAHVTYHQNGKIDYEIFLANGERHFLTLERAGNSVVAYSEEGNFLGRVGDMGGQPAFLQQLVN